MKSVLHTIFIWILSLSLTGLPVVALSQSIIELGHAEEKDTTTKVSDEHAGDMPCHSMAAETDVKDLHVKMRQAEQNTMQAQNAAIDLSNKSMNKGCCGADCECQNDMDCQTVDYSGAAAILQSVQFISFPLISQRAIEFVISYDSCNGDVEITPQIV